MYCEIKKNHEIVTANHDGTEIPCYEYIVRIPAVNDGVSGAGMVSRTRGTTTTAEFDAYTVDMSTMPPTVATEHKAVSFDGQPTAEKVKESIDKAYPAHGEISMETVPGNVYGIPVELFEALSVKVIRPASQR